MHLSKMVIGDRCGDRLSTTYHRSTSAMNRAFQKSGDRLKEDFHFFVHEREKMMKYFLSISPKQNKNELILFTKDIKATEFQ